MKRTKKSRVGWGKGSGMVRGGERERWERG